MQVYVSANLGVSELDLQARLISSVQHANVRTAVYQQHNVQALLRPRRAMAALAAYVE